MPTATEPMLLQGTLDLLGRRTLAWGPRHGYAVARWIRETFGIEAYAARDLGLRDAKDPVIFNAVRDAKVVVMSKGEDFRLLVERLGPPPQVLWLTCGNTSNARLRIILTKSLPTALKL